MSSEPDKLLFDGRRTREVKLVESSTTRLLILVRCACFEKRVLSVLSLSGIVYIVRRGCE